MIMSSGVTDRKPAVLMFYFEEDINRILSEVLTFEGYAVTSTSQAADALRILGQDDARYLILMDNVHINFEAHALLTELHVRPGLRERVKVVGMTVSANWSFYAGLDVFREIDGRLTIPFTIDELLDAVEPLSRQLPDGA